MKQMLPLHIWVSLLLVVRALVIQVAPERDPNLTESTLLPSQLGLIQRLNQSSRPSGITADRPLVICEGNEYGRNLVAEDCKDAITGVKRNRQKLRFGERSAPQETWDVGLPFRRIGSKDAT